MIEVDTVAQRSVTSGVWLFTRKIALNLIRLATVGILARHLQPADFGIVALAQVLLQFLVLAQETGVGTYVICDQAPGWERRTNSAFWLNLVITTGQVLVILAVLPIVTHFYPKPILRPILAVLACAFFVGQLGDIPEALLKRRLDYRRLILCDTTCDLFSATLSVAMALTGCGLWSLILPQAVIQPFRLAALVFLSGWRPAFNCDFRDWPPIFKFSAHLIASYLFILVANDGDTLLVGKLLGSHALGYYNLAWQSSNLVSRNITSVISSIAVPSLALLKENLPRLALAYRRMLRLLATVTFPLLFGAFVLAEDLIRLVYGPRWEPVATLLRIFLVFSMLRSVTSPCGAIYSVVGRPDVGSKFAALFMPFYLGAILLGSRWGVVGVATGVTVVRTLGSLVSLMLSARLVRLPLLETATTLLRIGTISGLMACLVGLLREATIPFNLPLMLRVVLCAVTGAVFYGMMIALFERDAFLEAKRLIGALMFSVTARWSKVQQRCRRLSFS